MGKKEIHVMSEKEYEQYKKRIKKEEWKQFKKEHPFPERCFMFSAYIIYFFGSFYLLFFPFADEIFSFEWFCYKILGLFLAISGWGPVITE